MQRFFMPLAATVSLALSPLVGLSSTDAASNSETIVLNRPTADENAAIRQLLDNYTHSVSTGDRQLFESQLLDLSIPFSGIDVAAGGVDKLELNSIQNYQGFRNSIFDSGKKFKQRFTNVKIEQLRNVAQVSLDYETALQEQDYSGKGWKVLQLVKVKGRWKIASELYTAGY